MNAADLQEDGRPPETHTQPQVATVAHATVLGTGRQDWDRSRP
jgi:hypothetical protein